MFCYIGKGFLLLIFLLVGCDKSLNHASNDISDPVKKLDTLIEDGDHRLDISQSARPALGDSVVGYQIWVRSFYDSDGDGNEAVEKPSQP